MSFLLLFQNLLHERENRSLFHQKKSVHFRSSHLNTEKFPFYLLLSCCGRIPCRGYIPRESFLTNRQMRDPSTQPLFQPRRLLSAMQEQPVHCSQAVPAGCPWVHKAELTLSQPRAALCAPAASLGSLNPHLCWARASLPDSLVQDTSHCQNCSLITGRLI